MTEHDTDWVCENHTDKPWAGLYPDAPDACDCGAGMLRRDEDVEEPRP